MQVVRSFSKAICLCVFTHYFVRLHAVPCEPFFLLQREDKTTAVKRRVGKSLPWVRYGSCVPNYYGREFWFRQVVEADDFAGRLSDDLKTGN